jgi:hypothetical protein
MGLFMKEELIIYIVELKFVIQQMKSYQIQRFT